jgi:hypothetical protein
MQTVYSWLVTLQKGEKKMQKFELFVRVSTLALITMLLIVMLWPVSAIAETYMTTELEIQFIKAYDPDPIWTDRGSRANRDVSFWRPTPADGYYCVGHHAKDGHGFPTEETMVVKERKPGEGALKPPLNYELIWNDAGSGASRNVSVWRPVCPGGYEALGDVANKSYGKPSTDEVRCIRKYELEEALPGGFIWNDSASGAKRDFGCWGIQARAPDSTYSYLSRGLFYGASSHSRPEDSSVSVLWAVKMIEKPDAQKAQLMSDHLLFDFTEVFEKIWDDAGSGAEHNVGFFRPVPRAGYYALGHYAHASYAVPRDTVVIVVKEKTRGALAAPLNYERIWTDAGSGAKRNVAVWWPSCPDNYVALGLVTTSGAKPSTEAIRCVRQDLTAPAEQGEEIWNDSASGAKRDFKAWRVKANNAPSGETYVSPGTFIGHASYSPIGNAKACALKMKLPLFPSPRSLSLPELSGYGRPSDFESQTVTSEVYLPFTAVKDNKWSPAKMAKDSPYYKLVRTDQYKLIDHIYNNTTTAQSMQWCYSIAFEDSESFTHGVGVSLTGGYKSPSTTGGFEASITLSYSFTYQTSERETEKTDYYVPVTALPGKAVAAYSVRSSFQLYRADGSQVGRYKASANRPDSAVFVEYPHREGNGPNNSITTPGKKLFN